MSTSVYRMLADLSVIVHLVFVVFVMLGGLLAIRWRRLMWLHLPAAIWGAAIEFRGAICPLTPLENWLREAGGAARYSGGFMEHYVMPVVYPTDLTLTIRVVLGCMVVAVNLCVYYFIVARARPHYSQPCDLSSKRHW